ncbi:RapGAP/RanGAP domain-containing protein [Cavenderia fasciculata]|uniref:RapGAP/RanGAP domain-containing protein n=1 Tax=Cavenderia fasciculata TaxID=261658 RepID=F4PMG3_CACFS|nr:RapGAP/RanGAP domain-containing protein [Cavenderia fasciculata]EGG23610.1 RapGAP/RanGAP domain-containing protein [Cavenderia fasciculata]|eukprot:XP_004361461.1 RapGAP/RanGAP domain-containing protein [Cavenderia fasciculata]
MEIMTERISVIHSVVVGCFSLPYSNNASSLLNHFQMSSKNEINTNNQSHHRSCSGSEQSSTSSKSTQRHQRRHSYTSKRVFGLSSYSNSVVSKSQFFPTKTFSSKTMNRSDVKINVIDTVTNSKLSGLQVEDEDKKAEDFQKILLDTIPIIIRGTELIEDEIETITSADTLVEKRLPCQVLIDVSKILRDYPRGMGFKCKGIPPMLHGKPKLIGFRNNMDQLGWEIISKLSILREFVENTMEIHKLYVIALSIRDCKNAFITNKSDNYLRSAESLLNPQTENGSVGSGPSSPRRTAKHVPIVMSRAPKQVIESTRDLVDSAITRKALALSKDDNSHMFREMISERFNLLNGNPKGYGMNLLQQRKTRMIGNSAEATLLSGDDSAIGLKNSPDSHGRTHHSNSIDIGYAALFTPPTAKEKAEFSPPRSPPTSPEMISKSPTGASSKRFADLMMSPRSSDRVLKHYKLLSSSPSSSASNVASYAAAQQTQQQQNQQQHLQQQLQIAADKQDVEWEKLDETIKAGWNTMVSQPRGFKCDFGSSLQKEFQPCSAYPVLYDEDDEYLYRDDFYDKEHFNYLGQSKGNGEKNLVSISAVSVPLSTGEVELLYIIRTPDRDERVRIVASNKRDSKDMIKMIKKSRQQLQNYKFKEVKEKAFTNDLLDFEKKNTVHRNFKFGVLYCRDGQTEENDMYANHEPHLSERYLQFVELLGERVELKGWPHYRGGLDIRDNMTGSHAIYRRWRDYELMFHISTMIPYKEDEQQIDRKRHLGNDIVMIVFKEGSTPFDPSICKSNFNHIFAVVEYDETLSTPENPLYRFSVSCRDEVIDFGPSFPKYHSFTPSELKEFLVIKLVNGERQTLKSPVFSQKFKRTRREFLQSYFDQYLSE